MRSGMTGGERLQRELTGRPVELSGHVIQPIAQLTGRAWRRTDDASGSGAAFLRLRPLEVIVRDENGDESRLAVTDPTSIALRGMGVAAAAVAGIALAVSLTTAWLSRRGAVDGSTGSE